MKDYLGIINLNEREDNIKELTYNRSIGSIPIAGRYRVIDFALSNMVNADIQNIGIFTQNKYRSLIDHLGKGKAWDLDRKIDGLFVFNPVFNYCTLGIYRGDLENLKDNIDYINTSRQSNVIVTSSQMIFNINYRDVIKFHHETGADITLVYKTTNECITSFQNCSTLILDESKRVIDTGINIEKANEGTSDISMDVFIMKKSLLLDIIYTSISKGGYNNLKDAVYKNINKLKVYAYEFDGYLACINSIKNYYKTSMHLLNQEISKELFFKNGLVYTKIKDEPPARYKETSVVSNSLIANGCIIEGTVENSIIFRGVRVEKDAVVRNSILMQNSIVEKGVLLRNVILDKNVIITKDKQLKGDENYPIVIEKKAVI